MTTRTVEQTIQQERADIWRAAAALTREHRAGVIAVAGNGSSVAIALWHLAKAFGLYPGAECWMVSMKKAGAQ